MKIRLEKGAAKIDQHKYLTHLIRFHTSKTAADQYWAGKAEVQYNDGKGFRFFEGHGPAEKKFISRSEAEQYIIQTAKHLIDKFI